MSGRSRGVRDSELAAHPQVLRHEPLDDEVVRKSELVALVVVVQVGVPQRVADGLGFEQLGVLVIIEVAVDPPLVVVLLEIGVGLRILREGDRGIVGFLIIEREFVAELEFPGPVDQVDVAADGLTVGNPSSRPAPRRSSGRCRSGSSPRRPRRRCCACG